MSDVARTTLRAGRRIAPRVYRAHASPLVTAQCRTRLERPVAWPRGTSSHGGRLRASVHLSGQLRRHTTPGRASGISRPTRLAPYPPRGPRCLPPAQGPGCWDKSRPMWPWVDSRALLRSDCVTTGSHASYPRTRHGRVGGGEAVVSRDASEGRPLPSAVVDPRVRVFVCILSAL